MEHIKNGSLVTPAGFRVGAAACGIKSTPGAPNVALLVSEGPASAAGVFTTNKFPSAAVEWCRGILPSAGVRAVVVNSGNANACTGAQGRADVAASTKLVAELVGCAPEQVCMASTGIIGHPLPMEKLTGGIRSAHAALANAESAGRAAERAIMTTDTTPKACAVRSAIGGAAFHVGGMTKGSGMIAPHMATMLAFVTTDAAVPPGLLQEMLRDAANRTFNRIIVDGDSSTNDTILALAGGASQARVEKDGRGRAEFGEALHAVLAELALKVVADGEGATRTIEVKVDGAVDEADAEKAARAVAQSPLVKCAVYGGDPNWGRIVCALGYSGAQIEPDRTSVRIGDVLVLKNGTPTGKDAAPEMQKKRVLFQIALGLGEGRATVWGCDLTEEYVRINSAYHT